MDRIVSDPAIMGGVPCVRGTRIPVTTIAGLLAENVSVADVLDSYPTLTVDDLRACQQYGRKVVRELWSAQETRTPRSGR